MQDKAKVGLPTGVVLDLSGDEPQGLAVAVVTVVNDPTAVGDQLLVVVEPGGEADQRWNPT